MAIMIGRYEFDGPFEKIELLKDDSGLLAVLHCTTGTEDYELVNITQAENIRQGIELSPSSESDVDGQILFAALYTPTASIRERRAMVEDIQLEFADGEEEAAPQDCEDVFAGRSS